MLYAMIAKDAPGMGEKRLTIRPVHLKHLESLGNQLKLAGALLDTDGKPEGSLVVIEAETLEAATAIFQADPFVPEGVFGSMEIKPWRVAIDNLSVRE